MKNGFLLILFCTLLTSLCTSAFAQQKYLGDVNETSRAIPVHLIPLYDQGNQKILPTDRPLLPFSMENTCGSTCHNYNKINAGWHFNSTDSNVPAGRPGQPWIFVDIQTGTQIPISYRAWPGTYRPQQIGLSPWEFTLLFGRQTAGGGAGQLESDVPEEAMRQAVSGKLENNCLACHSANPAQDQVEYALQIARQNLYWAATAASGLASVEGAAKDMADTYDYLIPRPINEADKIAPKVIYRDAFDYKHRVLFDTAPKVPDTRCYFCHTTVDVDKKNPQTWTEDEDVHLMAGLSCSDCHREGLAHDTIRGYENETAVSKNPLAASSSCKGCHMEQKYPPVAGRLGAPVPIHAGIPIVHFDKLTCTACHSGTWPTNKSHRVKTSMAHGLGLQNVNPSADVLPHITGPVFVKQYDGKIAPHNMVWPCFWASIIDNNVAPLDVESVRPVIEGIVQTAASRSGNWVVFKDEQIAKILAALTSQKLTTGKPVYVSAGKIYQLNDSGQLASFEHPAASPYSWPIAHNVRPAAQSLGSRLCQDCHSTKENFFFGQVAIDSPLASAQNRTKKMIDFQAISSSYTSNFAKSFVFRPLLKVVTLASSAVLALVLLLYGLKALLRIAKVLVGKE